MINDNHTFNEEIYPQNEEQLILELKRLRKRNAELEASDKKRQEAERVKNAVYRISEATLQAVDLGVLYRLMHNIIGELIPASNFYIALYNEDTRVIHFPYWVDEYDEQPEPRKAGRGLTEYVIRTGNPLLATPHIADQLEASGEIETIGADSLDWLGVPLVSKDKTIGALAVQTYSEGVRYGEEDKDILAFVSTQVAMAIERKRAGDGLKESEERYREIFDTIGDSIFIIEPDGTILDANPIACENYGYDCDQLIGQHITCLITPEYHPVFYDYLNGLKETGSYHGETVDIRKDGSLMNSEITGASIRLKGKECFLSIVRDVTARKRAKEEKQKLEDQLRQSQKMEAIGNLAGGIAHDFNNVLCAIMGYTELAGDDCENNPTLKQKLDKILRAGHRAKELVRQILAFSRKDKKEKEPVFLGYIVDDALKLLRSTLPTTIEIRSAIEQNLLPVMANPTQMHQVVMNICTNAGHAMKENGGILEITLKDIELDPASAAVKGLLPGKYQRLVFSDSGCGMPLDVKMRIFEPYFTTKNDCEGTGLGLAVVHGIVKSHDGEITVYSEKDKGTTFHVLLPVTKEGKIVASEHDESLQGGNERLLLVDDESDISQLEEWILKSLGYNVTCKTSSIDALEIFRSNPNDFDLVITDQTMPKMTGLQLAAELKKLKPQLPVILCTGFSESINEENYRARGIDAFLMKPFVRCEIAGVLRQVMTLKN
jgi:PAS domain S-box-containing protein